MKLYTLYFLIVFLFIGCGYKPSSYYAKKEITGKVHISSSIDIENSENSVIIKDTMNEMIINQFNATLTNDKNLANTLVIVKLSGVSHQALSTDNDGYTNSYRTIVSITVSYKKNLPKEKYKVLNVSNYYDYTVDADSLITDQKKLEATRLASANALSDLFSKIAINSFKVKK